VIPDIEDLPPICLCCDMADINLLALELIDAVHAGDEE